MKSIFRLLLLSTALIVLLNLASPLSAVQAQTPDYSLRFYGHGTNDIDRVKIPLNNPARPVDVGLNFTIEFWLRALAGENNRGADCQTGGAGWIYGHVILDRDIYGNGDYGDYGISLGNDGRIAFGVARGSVGETICSSGSVTDGNWHHIAVTRNATSGEMRIYVDGVQQASGAGPTGDISYRDWRRTNYPNSDPYLVLGAEKHDAGSSYPSFSGWLDELRVSNTIRYTSDFTSPAFPFVQDTATVALYHFNEGPLGPCTGAIRDFSRTGTSAGACRYGGVDPAGPQYSAETPFDTSSAASEWTQFAHDPQHTGYTAVAVSPPWRWKWVWNGSDARGNISFNKFRLPRNSQPVVGNGLVYVAAGTRGVFAINNETGRTQWNRRLTGSALSTPAYDPQTDTLYALSSAGILHRLNARNGIILKTYRAAAGSTLPLPPILVDQRVYFSIGNFLYALDKNTLAVIWQYNAGSPVETPPAWSANYNALVVVTQDLYVHSVDAASGAQNWRVKPTPLLPGNPNAYPDNASEGSQYASPRNGWPVIAEEHGIVFVRYMLHWQSIWSFDPALAQSNADIRNILQTNRAIQPLYALNLSDGSEAFIPNVGNGGFGDGGYLPMGPMPVVKNVPGQYEVAYVMARGWPCDGNASSCDGRADSHYAEMALDDTTVSGQQAGYVRYITGAFIPTDEQPFLSMAGDHLLAAHWEAGVAVRVTDRAETYSAPDSGDYLPTENLPHIVVSQDNDECGSGFSGRHYCGAGLFNTRPWPGGFYIYWRKGNVYDRYWSEYASWVVNRDTVYFVSADGAVVALQSGDPLASVEAKTLYAWNVPSVAEVVAPKNMSLASPVPFSATGFLNTLTQFLTPRVIPYSRAAEFAGRQMTVEGRLEYVFNNGKAVYLGFRYPHQGAFKVLIPKAAWANFPVHPQEMFAIGQRVRVHGLIGWYQGDPAMIIAQPSHIEILR